MDIVWSLAICIFCSVLLHSGRKENPCGVQRMKYVKALLILLALAVILAVMVGVTL